MNKEIENTSPRNYNIINDLIFLSNINEIKYIFVFDFDLTLTTKSSNGINVESNFIELFDSEDKLNKLKNILLRITERGYIIYINTRALVADINYILKIVGIDVGKNKIIKEIFGSVKVSNIYNPFTDDELDKYKIKNISSSSILWGIKKVTNLNLICDQESVNKNSILFFDDSIININSARINGYINSFLIGNNDSGLFGLDYLLIKLEQILFLIK
jgi:hypothetical protein